MSIANWIYLNNEIMIKKDGQFQFEKDKDAVSSYFREYIIPKMRVFPSLKKKLDYCIENKYYVNFYDMYSMEEMTKVFNTVYEKKFRFGSYMSAFKFYQNYALRDDAGDFILESYEDRIAIVALFIAQGNADKAIEYSEIMIRQEYQPATPTFLNAGRYRSGELVSCFLEEMGDSLSSIGYLFDSSMKLSSIGGGVSINLSNLRARGEAIKGVDKRASGVLPVMKILEDIFSYANQLGQRPGAGAAYLNIFHMDIVSFLECKKINVDEKIRIKSLSIGVIIPDKFLELAEENKPFYAFGPHSIFKEYGISLDALDINLMYEELVKNPKVKKKQINPRELLIEIAKTQRESGYPYLFFKDNANRNHPLKAIGQINFSNLCTEIMQLSEISEIGNYNEEDTIKRGISCILGSLNIATVMENQNLKSCVKSATEFLSSVSDIVDIGMIPSIQKANNEFHSIGLGAMNLHGFLAKNYIPYESKEALDFCNIFFMMLNYYSLEASMEIAKDKGKKFENFEKSEYASGVYFDQYTSQEYRIQTEKVRELFKNMPIPSLEDWKILKLNVMKYGLYNAYRIAIAPNQSTAYIMNATPSVMPVTDIVEVREYGDSVTYYPMPFLAGENIFIYKSAYDMKPENISKLISIIQKHVDQGISTILFSNSADSTKELARQYIFAHKLGLKSLYYTRTKKSVVEECLSCSV